ncbi:restriction endonuclease [Peribacillus sp. SIMBA_075]|uniref:restriction endonuclease n=1 Tax=Peribacillus sp. SIMBA_075 TaxID=3085813 RepID=UPI00397D623B
MIVIHYSFPKDITDSMRTCILSIFWPKSEIISFFRSNGCTKRDLQNVANYDETNLSRAKIVDTLFGNLQTREGGGLGPFRSMLQSLVEWNHFDPYYFKKLKKLDENEALRNINHLKQLQEIRDEKIKKQKLQRMRKEEEINQNRKNFHDLNIQYTNLYKGLNEQGKAISMQQRGYLLEDFIKNLCIYEKISIADPFKIIGEQIDGAIKFEGENYILEAKWQEALVASNSLYQFAYKIEGKFYGRGIFISINGFSRESVEALKIGKALKTILIDGSDLAFVVEGIYSFNEILEKKISAAQTMGKIYIDVSTMQDKKI